jgi:hypothetical protein
MQVIRVFVYKFSLVSNQKQNNEVNMLLRFIFKLNVAIGAAKHATFGRRKMAQTWYERYLRHYVFFSLKRPNSYFMLSGDDNCSKWFPSGPKLLATTGVIKWSQSYDTFGPTEKSPTRINFRHNNQVDLLANYHPEEDDEGQSQAQLFVHFDNLKQANAVNVEEIEITNEDAIAPRNSDVLSALDEYINKEAKEEVGTDIKHA